VFNDEWEVVALHHSGVPERDIHGNILTKDGRVWRQWMGEHRINWVANEGVRISRIVKHIKAQGLSTNQSKLLSQMFELDQPILDFRTTPVLSSSGNGTGGGHLRPTSPGMALAAGSPTVGDDGSVTFTIPIQVNIQVPRATVMKAPNVATAGGTVDTAPQGSPEEQELSEALQEFERARTRVYYDQDQDRVSRDVYYTEIDCRTSPDALYRSLSKLVKGTHTRRLKYNPSTHVYPWVDLQPDLKLRSVYSSLIFEPDEFIREDFRIGQERAQAIQMFLATEGTFRPERLEQEIDMLEDLRPFNCEHVVPQSWFVKKEPMRGDLHHLFACESGCNSFRSNIAYYDFADFEEVVRGACGKREENKFEPSSGKGVVARATLYFLLRYPGQINDLEGEFDRDRLPILLQWHEHDPVSPYERHRNMAIHEKQGNRNPLIDFPEWASVINFNNGFA
jgi:endonuclease I